MAKYLKSKNAKRTCQAKQKYPNAEAAWAAARALQKKGAPARAYRCSGLRGQQRHWHVTSGLRK